MIPQFVLHFNRYYFKRMILKFNQLFTLIKFNLQWLFIQQPPLKVVQGQIPKFILVQILKNYHQISYSFSFQGIFLLLLPFPICFRKEQTLMFIQMRWILKSILMGWILMSIPMRQILKFNLQWLFIQQPPLKVVQGQIPEFIQEQILKNYHQISYSFSFQGIFLLLLPFPICFRKEQTLMFIQMRWILKSILMGWILMSILMRQFNQVFTLIKINLQQQFILRFIPNYLILMKTIYSFSFFQVYQLMNLILRFTLNFFLHLMFSFDFQKKQTPYFILRLRWSLNYLLRFWILYLNLLFSSTLTMQQILNFGLWFQFISFC